MYYISSEAAFDAAHFLSKYDGKCSNLHGHRWRVILKIQSNQPQLSGQQRGMVMDFGDIKSALKKETDYFDHTFIYEEGTLRETTIKALEEEGFLMRTVGFRPTAENFAKYFYDIFTGYGFMVAEVTVYETPNNCATYSEV